MKTTRLSLFLLFLASFGVAQEIQKAEFLTSKDLGIHKWIFKGSPAQDEVFILRTTTKETNGEWIGHTVHDRVHYSPFKPVELSVLFKNMNHFAPGLDYSPDWRMLQCQAHGARSIKGWIKSVGDKDSSTVFIHFQQKNGDSDIYTYEVFIVSYQEANQVYENLGEMSENFGWGYSAHFEKGKEPQFEKPKHPPVHIETP